MRGQVQIFTEFLTFAIGIITVISITYIFSQQLSPLIIKEATNKQLESAINHVNVLSSQLIQHSNTFKNKKQTLIINMPNTIGQKPYQIYALKDKLCATTNEYLKCLENTYSVTGTYTSGSRMKLEYENNKITLSNQ